MSLIALTVRLYHRKEQECFDDLHDMLCDGKDQVHRRGHHVAEVWGWALNRWGKEWPKKEYEMRGSK